MQIDRVLFFNADEVHIVANNLVGDDEQVFEIIMLGVLDIMPESKVVIHFFIVFVT